MSSKRPQTFAKRAREQMVKERRALKLEKKRLAREAKAAENADTTPAGEGDAEAADVTVGEADVPR